MVRVSMRPRNSSFSRSMVLVYRADRHGEGSRCVKVKSRPPFRGLRRPTGATVPLYPGGCRRPCGTSRAICARRRLAAGLHLGGGLGVDHVAIVLSQLVVHRLRRVAEEVAVRSVIRTSGVPALTVHGIALDRQVLAPQRGERGLRNRRAVHDDELRAPEVARIEILEVRAAVLSPPLFLTDNSTFCPPRRTPIAARTEMFVAFRSNRVLITVPARSEPATAIRPRERANRTMSSLTRLRARPEHPRRPAPCCPGPADHVLGSTAPRTSPNTARLLRRVLVPER